MVSKFFVYSFNNAFSGVSLNWCFPYLRFALGIDVLDFLGTLVIAVVIDVLGMVIVVGFVGVLVVVVVGLVDVVGMVGMVGMVWIVEKLISEIRKFKIQTQNIEH